MTDQGHGTGDGTDGRFGSTHGTPPQGGAPPPGPAEARGNPLVAALLRTVAGTGGGEVQGLTDLVVRVTAGGLGDQARSWVSVGRNQPISGREITDALGASQIDWIAVQAGLTREETAAAVAAMLPRLVDAFTPLGDLPEQREVRVAVAHMLGEPVPPAEEGSPDSGEASDESPGADSGPGGAPGDTSASAPQAPPEDTEGDTCPPAGQPAPSEVAPGASPRSEPTSPEQPPSEQPPSRTAGGAAEPDEPHAPGRSRPRGVLRSRRRR